LNLFNFLLVVYRWMRWIYRGAGENV